MARNIWGRMLLRPTRVREKPARFHITPPEYVKNAPDFALSNKDTPKTYPVLAANLWRGTFWGVCFCAPTRVHAKPARFHISAHGYTKNAPDFTIPNRDTPKTRSILDPNLWRGTFGGICFCALHGYTQNLAGFTFPHLNTPKKHLFSPFPIGIDLKPTRF